MAKIILEQKLKERGRLNGFEIDSAGSNATTDDGVTKSARAAIKKIYGQDLLANHKAKEPTTELTEQADLILVMTEAIRTELPPEKSWTLKEYAGGSGDIADLIDSILEKMG